jgi:hypothetical protein
MKSSAKFLRYETILDYLNLLWLIRWKVWKKILKMIPALRLSYL